MKKGRTILLAACGALLLVALLRACVFTTCLIPSTGMENTLLQGDRIVVNKWSYGLRLPLMSLWGYHRWMEQPVQRKDFIVFNNPANRREMTISRREVFTGRCIGLPGDTLWVDSLFTVSPTAVEDPDHTALYAYPRQKEQEMEQLLQRLSIPHRPLMGQDTARHIRSFSRYEYYLLEQEVGTPCWVKAVSNTPDAVEALRPLLIPRRGESVRVTPWNCALLCNTLVLHEGRRAEVKGDTLLIEGRPVTHCTFTQDYYWVAANNAINFSDSRLFGFVPRNHLIGRATRIWFSQQPGTSWLEGIRWERVGREVK